MYIKLQPLKGACGYAAVSPLLPPPHRVAAPTAGVCVAPLLPSWLLLILLLLAQVHQLALLDASPEVHAPSSQKVLQLPHRPGSKVWGSLLLLRLLPLALLLRCRRCLLLSHRLLRLLLLRLLLLLLPLRVLLQPPADGLVALPVLLGTSAAW